jgi:hypothetical protein
MQYLLSFSISLVTFFLTEHSLRFFFRFNWIAGESYDFLKTLNFAEKVQILTYRLWFNIIYQ